MREWESERANKGPGSVEGPGSREGSGFRAQGSENPDGPRADESKPEDGKAEQSPIGFDQVKAFVKRLGPAGPLAVISASMPFVAAATILGSMPWVGSWMQSHQHTGALLYFSCFTALGGIGFMPTHAYSLLGGYAFGFKLGLALALASYLGASLLAYAVARLASGDRVVQIIAEHPKSKAVYEALLGSGFGKTLLITFLVRLTSSPFAITNLILAATRVNLVAYVAATVVGMVPRTAALVYIASMWGLDGNKAASRWVTITFSVVTLAVLFTIGHVGNQAIARVTRPADAERHG